MDHTEPGNADDTLESGSDRGTLAERLLDQRSSEGRQVDVDRLVRTAAGMLLLVPASYYLYAVIRLATHSGFFTEDFGTGFAYPVRYLARGDLPYSVGPDFAIFYIVAAALCLGSA